MSETIDDGGPAFPLGDFEWHQARKENNGMRLRDAFAIAALNQRKALSFGGWYADDAAREAYEIADAMLAARKVK